MLIDYQNNRLMNNRRLIAINSHLLKNQETSYLFNDSRAILRERREFFGRPLHCTRDQQ